jgi:hypothetical protein
MHILYCLYCIQTCMYQIQTCLYAVCICIYLFAHTYKISQLLCCLYVLQDTYKYKDAGSLMSLHGPSGGLGRRCPQQLEPVQLRRRARSRRRFWLPTSPISATLIPPPHHHLLPLSQLPPTLPPQPIPGGGAANNGSRCRCCDVPGAGAANNGSR